MDRPTMSQLWMIVVFISAKFVAPSCGCGGQFVSPSGTITSPSYPGSYANNLNCEYLVSTTDVQKVISLSFEVFDLESASNCGYDSLTVYDGTSTSNPVLGVFCGSTIPFSLMSSGRSLFLVFKTDHSVTNQGFSASYQAVENGDINACASNPCLNGGACSNLLDIFTCDCVAGYDGIRCDSGERRCGNSSSTSATQGFFLELPGSVECTKSFLYADVSCILATTSFWGVL